MAEIIQFIRYKTDRGVRASFEPWRRCFNETFDARTKLGDLSESTLRGLAQPGETATGLIYELILGLLGCGEYDSFDALGKTIQMQVIDIHLFLSDQIRFEMMRRLGWLSKLSVNQYTIVDMVSHFNEIKLLCQQQPPVLAPTHPQYEEYMSLVDRDRQVLIRRLLPSALEAFTQVQE